MGKRWPHGLTTRRTGAKGRRSEDLPTRSEHATANQDQARKKKGLKGSPIPEVPFTAASTTPVTHDRERFV